MGRLGGSWGLSRGGGACGRARLRRRLLRLRGCLCAPCRIDERSGACGRAGRRWVRRLVDSSRRNGIPSGSSVWSASGSSSVALAPAASSCERSSSVGSSSAGSSWAESSAGWSREASSDGLSLVGSSSVGSSAGSSWATSSTGWSPGASPDGSSPASPSAWSSSLDSPSAGSSPRSSPGASSLGSASASSSDCASSAGSPSATSSPDSSSDGPSSAWSRAGSSLSGSPSSAISAEGAPRSALASRSSDLSLDALSRGAPPPRPSRLCLPSVPARDSRSAPVTLAGAPVVTSSPAVGCPRCSRAPTDHEVGPARCNAEVRTRITPPLTMIAPVGALTHVVDLRAGRTRAARAEASQSATGPGRPRAR